MTRSTSSTSPNVPAWAKDAIFYAIFPDRFARSEQLTKPTNLLRWDEPPTDQGYYGGDLLGIVEQLDYLSDLGVTAIYLTPIFQSASNHRYHTHDYEKVDPLLGGNEALRKLIEEVHRRDMRIILDGVFNHASRGFYRFSDILENGPHSPWVDWFIIQGWPLAPYVGDRPANYASWFDNRALPKFNTENPQVREYLISIGEYWIREYDIDGWRLDVPDEIKTEGFWEEFRERVRALRPDAYLVGEIWHYAREWLRGDRFDATMNYSFAAAITAFAAGSRVSSMLARDRPYQPYPGIDAPQFGQRIAGLLSAWHWETTQVQFNMLDSHDVPRLLSLARGDKDSLRLATLFQMTYPGTPCIYYGDEIALPGTEHYNEPHQDQDARRPFPWHDESAWDLEMRAYFQSAIALRKAYPVLRHGRFKQLYATGRCYAFSREDSQQSVLVVLNADDAARQADVPLKGRLAQAQQLRTVFGNAADPEIREGHLHLRIPARSGLVLAEH